MGDLVEHLVTKMRSCDIQESPSMKSIRIYKFICTIQPLHFVFIISSIFYFIIINIFLGIFFKL